MQQQKPLEGAQLVIMTIALSLATFMQVLDSTIANVAIPTIASWACGVSNSLTMLIFFRVIQGIVAGPLIPLSQVCCSATIPRRSALSLWRCGR
ncbi:multidrug resistance protein B [Klebsiella pneumoniae]|uniref:Multidrug resistance protein B n=1 Tax=Klebsiella pneumoniae TaxID=573 RepID=A0A2X3I343_KLEPN|nr:multidrug resistance protein B [Klebsiella pneumoniae]